MTFREFFLALRRRWRAALVIALLSVVVAAAVTMLTPKVYESRTTVYFAATDETGASTGNLYSTPLTASSPSTAPLPGHQSLSVEPGGPSPRTRPHSSSA